MFLGSQKPGAVLGQNAAELAEEGKEMSDGDDDDGLAAQQSFHEAQTTPQINAGIKSTCSEAAQDVASGLMPEDAGAVEGAEEAAAAGEEEQAMAAAPTGRRGSPMKVLTRNRPGSVNGIDYTGHGFDQMQGRGITPSMVEEALRHGVASPGRNDTTVYNLERLRVVVNSRGAIVTVITL